MSISIAERLLGLLQHDQPTRVALLACSAALQLDDQTACEAVDLVAPANDDSYEVVRRVKELGCVWKEWNGLWHVAEDVRRGLLDRIYRELPQSTIVKLRELLAKKAEARAAQIEAVDQVAQHEKMIARFEAAYHRSLIPGEAKQGARDLIELWRQLPPFDGDTLALMVDYVAGELDQLLGHLQEEIVFLRGVAARQRGDQHTQEKYFDLVWKNPDLQSDVEAALNDDRKAHLHEQVYQYAVDYYRRRRSGSAGEPDTLVDDLYAEFFESHETAWRNEAEFYTYVAQLMRRLVIKKARTQFSTKLHSDLYNRLQNDEFGMQRAEELLAMDKALRLLRGYDSYQAHIVELRFYAGLTLEQIADVMQLSLSAVKREWRIATAVLKRELTRPDTDRSSLIPVSLMTNTNSFLREFHA
jgi:RNA polymerase sigma-70 factor, ECF subfamily